MDSYATAFVALLAVFSGLLRVLARLGSRANASATRTEAGEGAAKTGG